MVFLTPLFFKGERIRARHLLGALSGMAGAALILSGGRIQFQGAAALGYLSALAASVIWAVYSLATRWLPPFPSGAVGGFCMASGLLALGVFGIEYRSTGYLPVLRPVDWVYLALIGAGPCALAYFTWDASLKRGDPRLLGILTYLTPLTSSLLLIASGGYALSALTWLAMALIVGGAILSSIGRGGDSLAKQGELVP
jgi:drug/metabolite transporter (DMT)-like permease